MKMTEKFKFWNRTSCYFRNCYWNFVKKKYYCTGWRYRQQVRRDVVKYLLGCTASHVPEVQLTNQLTNEIITLWSRVLPEKLGVSQLIRNFPRILWNTKVCYCLYESPFVVLILSQTHPDQKSPILKFQYFSPTCAIIFPADSFLQFPPIEYLYVFLSVPMRVTCPVRHTPWFHQQNNVSWGTQIKKLYIMQFVPVSFYCLPLWPKHFPLYS